MPGVYLSYPFCAQKCTFCNFASGVFSRDLERQYVQVLLAEIDAHEWHWTPETVYIGGGTPSRLDGEALRPVLDAIPGRPWKEATIEGAPGSLTAANVRAWVEAGINRVSLGVQSFIPGEISRTGRKHTAQIVADDVALLRSEGIRNINIDLICGLAGQTPDSWAESLQRTVDLQPPHVSVYMFEVDEDSRLGLEVLQGGGRYGATSVPGEDMAAELYEAAVDVLATAGIERYEISNFAVPGMESVHNLKYWLLEPYVGFGADAHSFDGTLRWGNPETAPDYVQSRARVGEAVANSQEERFFVGLRLMRGVRPDAEDWAQYGSSIDRLVGAGLLSSDAGVLRLTPRGVLLSNEVFQEFITQ